MRVASSQVMTLCERHIFARHWVRLLHHRGLVGLSLMISILNFDLRKLIVLIQSTWLVALKEAV